MVEGIWGNDFLCTLSRRLVLIYIMGLICMLGNTLCRADKVRRVSLERNLPKNAQLLSHGMKPYCLMDLCRLSEQLTLLTSSDWSTRRPLSGATTPAGSSLRTTMRSANAVRCSHIAILTRCTRHLPRSPHLHAEPAACLSKPKSQVMDSRKTDLKAGVNFWQCCPQLSVCST